MSKGEWTTTELWIAFGEYEDNVRNSINPSYGHMNAAMANAIARIIAARESNGTSS